MTNKTCAANDVQEVEELITDLVKNVVNKPDALVVSCQTIGTLVAFVIKPDQDDVRRVVGSKGKHFRALETLLAEMLKPFGLESHLAIDEKRFEGQSTVPKSFVMGECDGRRFKTVSALLKRVVSPFVENPKTVTVTSTDVALSCILEVKLKAADYPSVYGCRQAEFDYGVDGHVIGAIKNIFDGIGKRHGRTIKIVLTKT